MNMKRIPFFHSSSSPVALAAALATTIGATECHAQNMMARFGEVGASGTGFGFATASIGDVNGDGWQDFAIGCPYDDTVGTDAGKVIVMSGRNGGPIREILGPSAGSLFGFSVRVLGDVQLNGTLDLAIGAPYWNGGAGLVRIHEALSGAVVQAYGGFAPNEHFGWALDGMGDLNGNQTPELAVGSPGHMGNQGKVYVYETLNQATIYSWTGQGRFGQAVLGCVGYGLRNNWPRIVVASNSTSYCCVNSWSMAQVGSTLLGSGWSGGIVTLAIPGDLNGDGTAEILVGWPNYSVGGTNSGAALLFSCRSGAGVNPMSWTRVGQLQQRLGADVQPIGDWNADTFADFAIGRPGHTAGHRGGFTVVSGRDFSTLAEINGVFGYGSSLAPATDINGDGFHEVFVGSPAATFPFAEIVSGSAHARLDGGCRATLQATRPNTLPGTTVTVQGNVSSSGPNALGLAIVVLGFRKWPMNMFDPATFCFWYVDLDLPYSLAFAPVIPGPGSGAYATGMPTASTPALLGASLMMQAITVSDPPYAFSNAMAILFR